jgi:DNA-binding response OmpR family regulator
MLKNILIIDDDEELCDEISEILIDEGFNVDIKHDGRDGFDQLKNNKYDLVLLDLRIPSMTGIEVLKKTKEKHIKTKVIILTGKPFMTDINKIKNIENDKDQEQLYLIKNSDGFLNKPYVIEELLALINKLVRT